MMSQSPDSPRTDRYCWQRQTIGETYRRICRDPSSPWLAVGDFLDDWRRSAPEDRLALVEDGLVLGDPEPVLRRWAAFCSAMVEWLCWQEQLAFPSWTGKAEFRLNEPWFLYPGHALRPWQLASTPAPFKLRNIFGGDHMLDRV
jgi:hypothetical protein